MKESDLSPLPPGSIIGIIGGGQLGRMLALAAARLGLITYIYTPETASPASQVAAKTIVAEYDDQKAIQAFAKTVDVLTYEFENVPSKAAIGAAAAVPVFPPIQALDVAQDRLKEKEFISKNAKVPVAPYHPIDNEFDAKRALKILGGKCVIKTNRLGYDGKGQCIVETEAEAMQAFNDLGGVGCIAEKFIPFTREVSIIAARGLDGKVTSFPLIENVHRNHILHTSICPAEGDLGQAQEFAGRILEALDYVGIVAVEFFQLADGALMVNEIAPRVHNSGHLTMDSGCTDQFEMHIRAISGWPLGNAIPLHTVEMTNLLGEEINDWKNIANSENVKIHFYGKSEARMGRKMGHINRIIRP